MAAAAAARAFLVALALLAGAGSTLPAAPAAAAELVMFERRTCPWCRAWLREIGPVYPKTEEGRRAPLRRVDLDEERPADLEHLGRVVFTPTFVLLEDGRELGRIVGYPGEDFFWGMLADLLARAPPEAR